MLCPNCKREILESSKYCTHCGAAIVILETIAENENDLAQPESKTTTFKDVVSRIFFLLFWLIMIYFGIVWLQQKSAEKKFNEQIYQQAVNELLSHYNDPSIVDIAGYKSEYISLQEWDYHDFGYGNLRYGRYEVTVPVSYDDDRGKRCKEEVVINVYYYTSDQNVTDGIDPMVEEHLYTPDMLQEIWNQRMEDMGVQGFEWGDGI